MILSKEAFDPDAVFLDDIVDDDVLPYLSLSVDGLTESKDAKKGKLELRPEDVAANEEVAPDTTMPVAPCSTARAASSDRTSPLIHTGSLVSERSHSRSFQLRLGSINEAK